MTPANAALFGCQACATLCVLRPTCIGARRKPWKTPHGELYEILEVYPGCTPLGQAFGSRTDKDHVCIWVNKYGKGRTFGTSLGHRAMLSRRHKICHRVGIECAGFFF